MVHGAKGQGAQGRGRVAVAVGVTGARKQKQASPSRCLGVTEEEKRDGSVEAGAGTDGGTCEQPVTATVWQPDPA